MAIVSFTELYERISSEKKTIYEIAQSEEACLQEKSVTEIRCSVKENLDAMKLSIKNGIKSSEKSISGWCGDDCIKIQKRYKSKGALFGKLFEKITTYALAVAEENLRMGRIVACPTAGSCGIVPSVLISVAEENEISEEKQIDALITAGYVGLIISYKVSLAGAVAGCQAECGVAAAMAAAAVIEMLGGTVEQIFQAVALALKNVLGLTCDPVCGLVEVPCIKRNAFLGVHAVTAAELAMAGIESKIPLDEVVDALKQTGQLMSPLLKETSQAGLAKTKIAKNLKKELQQKKEEV